VNNTNLGLHPILHRYQVKLRIVGQIFAFHWGYLYLTFTNYY